MQPAAGGTANIRAAVERPPKRFSGDIFVTPDTGRKLYRRGADVIEFLVLSIENTDWNDARSLGIRAAGIFKDGWTDIPVR